MKKRYDGIYRTCPKCLKEIPVDRKGNNFFRHDNDGNVIKQALLPTESDCAFSGRKVPEESATTIPMMFVFG